MSVQAVLLPVFVQVALTFFLLFWMGRSRLAALRRRETRAGDIALGQKAWPEKAQRIGNAFHNQLEVPVLFYLLVVLVLVTRSADLVFVVLSWVFVACRLLHAGIHIATNRLPQRFGMFAAGCIMLLLMWVMFAARIIIAA